MPSLDHATGPIAGIRGDLPFDRLRGAIFDMDGVITQSARVHFAAWKQLFDTFLTHRAQAELADKDSVEREAGAERAASYRKFDEDDYRRYVDGKPREAGVADFLASRGIFLPHGGIGDAPHDAPDDETVVGLGLRKNAVFLERVERDGVAVFPTTIRFAQRLARAGRRVAVISASENAEEILGRAGVLDRFDVKVDGLDSRALQLAGKPDPAIFLEAARRLGEAPSRLAVVEDALAGVEAGARGGFGYIIGIDRAGYRDELLAAGATIVVHDLGELLEPPEDPQVDQPSPS